MPSSRTAPAACRCSNKLGHFDYSLLIAAMRHRNADFARARLLSIGRITLPRSAGHAHEAAQIE